MTKIDNKFRRQQRIRAKVKKSGLLRLSVSCSNRFIYAQIIDDSQGKTLAAVSNVNNKKKPAEVGEELAKKALLKKVESVVFDRGSYRYHGRIKELADGARKGGLKF